jgi:U3 small nucleolar RNA-associated protein 21
MQSGLHRGYYASNTSDRLAHAGAVSGLAADGCNRYLVSGGLDGMLKVWSLKTRKLVREMSLGSKISKLTFHPNTCLVAVACDDLSIRICDIESGSIVRRFKGHVDRITDMQFSQDCRWLLTSSMDSTFRIWDVPGKL